jgi:O-antigen/teichoic acid export membrane protein
MTLTDSRVARGGLANLAGAAVAGLAGFGATWLVARTLGPVQAGGFFAATAAFTLAGTVAKLGTPTGLVYFIARLRARGASSATLRQCVRAGVGPVVVAGVLAGIGMWCTAPWLASSTGHHAPGYLAQLRVLAVFLPVAVLFDTVLAASRGWRRMRPTVVLDKLMRPGLQLAALALLALAAVRAPAWYALAWVAPYVVVALLAMVALRNLERRGAGDGTAAGFSAGRFWRFTGPRAVASVAHLALQRVDVLLLASIAGLRAAAVYAVAGRFVALGQLANQAILLAVQPRLAELLGADDRAGANALYQTATGWLILATWPMYLGTAVFATVYLGLFGTAYRDAAPVVVVLALAMLAATGCGMVDTVLAMAGRTSWNLANVVLALGVNLGVDLALIPRLGALGAAVGFAAATLANNLVPLSQVAAVLGLHPFGHATFVAAATATVCFGAIPLAVVAVTGATLPGALVAAALGGSGYAIALGRLRRVLRIDTIR